MREGASEGEEEGQTVLYGRVCFSLLLLGILRGNMAPIVPHMQFKCKRQRSGCQVCCYSILCDNVAQKGILYATQAPTSVVGRSHISGVKADRARRMLDLMSEGGSLEILMHVCGGTWREEYR